MKSFFHDLQWLFAFELLTVAQLTNPQAYNTSYTDCLKSIISLIKQTFSQLKSPKVRVPLGQVTQSKLRQKIV